MNQKLRCTVLLLLITTCSSVSKAQSFALSDSSMRETLTRAVQFWQLGKAKEAFLSLDSIDRQPIAAENATTKVKAALWTANYLMAQKKVKPAAPFLDSALIWAENHAIGEELIRAYDIYADWHVLAGNPKTAMVAKTAALHIRDSLQNRLVQHTIDSLEAAIAQLTAQLTEARTADQEAGNAVLQEAKSLKNWLYVAAAVCLILLIIIFLMNGTLQRLRNAPPAPVANAGTPKIVQSAKAGPPTIAPPPVDIRDTRGAAVPPPPPAAPAPAKPASPKPVTPPPLSGKDITLKLQEVELVLIRAEILGKYHNGETKAIRNLLNEYMAQLPFIMKTLDEAITKNESEPILLSLEHLKPYLQNFGMNNTLKLIQEVEEEAATEKVSKLLSRVFQIRNHCRRAADEGKALLEKIG